MNIVRQEVQGNEVRVILALDKGEADEILGAGEERLALTLWVALDRTALPRTRVEIPLPTPSGVTS